jgi:hypothetical protein
MAMPEYVGISENGDLAQALSEAISTAKEAIPSDYVNWEIVKISGANGGFTLVNVLEVTIAASPTSLRSLDSTSALFQTIDSSNKPFVIKLVEPDKIEHARRILRGEEKGRVHIQGTIVKEVAPYNPGRLFHLEPRSIDFFEVAIEVCDANVDLVENDLEGVGGDFLPGNHWCPWSSRLLREL